jgi:Chitobiase/beta-hexosaminidase C-terminal domain
MKAILLACAVVGASIQVQAQDAGAILLQQQALQMQQQASANNQAPFSPEQCAMSSLPRHLPAMRSASSSAPSNRFAVGQMESLTAPLQTSLSVLNIPLWSTWRVVPLSDQMSFSVKPGVVKPGTKVRLRWRAGQNEVAVYYTTDGWSPNPSSVPYKEPITINGPTHLQVVQLGWKSGPGGCVMRTRSQILDAYYDVASSASPSGNPAVVTDGLLRQGTVLKLVTAAAVDSRSARPGDKVSVLLDQDVKVGDTVVIPKGTPVDAVLAEAIPPQASRTGGMLAVAVRSLNEAGTSIELHGVETMEGHPGPAPKGAIIQPGMNLQAIVIEDVKLKS